MQFSNWCFICMCQFFRFSHIPVGGGNTAVHCHYKTRRNAVVGPAGSLVCCRGNCSVRNSRFNQSAKANQTSACCCSRLHPIELLCFPAFAVCLVIFSPPFGLTVVLGLKLSSQRSRNPCQIITLVCARLMVCRRNNNRPVPKIKIK